MEVMEEDANTRLTTLFEDHHADVLAYCVRRIGYAEGEDAAAEVFVVASRRADEIDWQTVRPWLFGVARGVLANRWRSLHRRQRMTRKVKGLASFPADSPDEIVIRGTEAREAISALRQLHSRDREILMLSAWEELTTPEIANSLEISVAAAKKRLKRAKERLAHVLQPPNEVLDDPGSLSEEGASQ